MKNRGGYEIYASIPLTMPLEERDIFSDVCKENEISTITAINETTRVKKLKERKFQIIIVGNVGKIEQISDPNTLAIMVYHGIGLKQTYYRDITDRIDIRVVESKERYDILKKQGQKNLVLTGYSKCDPLIEYDSSQKDILERMNKGLDVAFSNNKSIKDERPFFINKRTTKSKVNTFDDIVDIANNEALFREVLDTVLVYEQ